MQSRKTLMNNIVEKLSWIKAQVSLYNSVNLTDINIHAENFYRDLLNLIFDYSLENINIEEQNTAAIDLGDCKEKIAIQVTSSSDIRKIKKTIQSFTDKKLGEKYNQLKVLNITTKKKHREKSITINGWSFDTDNDLWDVEWVISKIYNLTTEHMQLISDFLDREVKLVRNSSVPKEVSTILLLIEYISDDSHPEAGNGYMEEPFPDEKINKRFSDCADDLKIRFAELFIEYGGVLKAVKDNADIGQVKSRRAGMHLRGFSDKILAECGGNPRLALDKLVNHFEEILGQNRVEIDRGAAEFYIVDQLIQCNVFPNRGVECRA